MFGLFKRKKASVEARSFENLGVDIHAHWLPGIDDGAKTLEDAMAMLRKAVDMGFHTVVATPHVYKEYYPNTRESIKGAAMALQQAIADAGLPVTLQVAAEYYLDDHFEELLAKRELLTFGKDQYLLVEQGFMGPVPNLSELIYQMQIAGYQIIMAHPERYGYYANDKYALEEVHDRGVFFQMNLLSLTGHYGKAVKEQALWLIKKGMVDLVGTDSHRMEHLEKLSGVFEERACKQLLDSGLKERQNALFY